jgi:hypothetical protein
MLRSVAGMTDTTTLPTLRELQIEQARQHVADGTLSLKTAHFHFPDVTDWPTVPVDDVPIRTPEQHHRNLAASFTSLRHTFALGYLSSLVRTSIEMDSIKNLREDFEDFERAAAEAGLVTPR